MKRYSEGEILKLLRERFQPPQGQNQTKTAADLGFSVQYINAVLSGSRPLTKEMAAALGFPNKHIYYTRNGKGK